MDSVRAFSELRRHCGRYGSVAIALASLLSATAHHARGEVLFGSAEKRVFAQCQSASVGQIAQARMKSEPKTPDAAVEDFLVYLRAGYDREFQATFPKIRQWSRQIGESTLGDLAEELINREQWEMVRKYLEQVPMAQPYSAFKFINAMRTVATPQELEAWLLERAKENRKWHRYRFLIAAGEGRLPALMESYRAYLTKNPSDLHSALDVIAGSVAGGSARQPIDWIKTTLQPRSASEAYVLATALAEAYSELSVVFARKSLSMPFTPEDSEWVEREMPPEEGQDAGAQEKNLRTATRYLLTRVLWDSGADEEARALERKLEAEAEEEMRKAEGDTASPVAASPVEAAGGPGKPVEPAPRAPEKGSELDAVSKTLDSANKLRDQDNFAGAAALYRQGLEAVGKPAEEKSETAERRNRLRWHLSVGLANCLKKTATSREAQDFFLTELSLWPVNAEIAGSFFGGGVEVLEREPAPAGLWEHPAVWKFLGERADWRGGVQLALRCLADDLPPEKRRAIWKRAASLASGNAGRCLALGSMGILAPPGPEAVDLLLYATNHLPPGEDRESAFSELYQAALRNKDWAVAEMAVAKSGLSERWLLRDLETLATSAMKAGDADTAMRCWERIVHFDRTHIEKLPELATLGLRDRLIAYYQKLAVAEPSCTMAQDLVPALEKLKR